MKKKDNDKIKKSRSKRRAPVAGCTAKSVARLKYCINKCEKHEWLKGKQSGKTIQMDLHYQKGIGP